MVEETNDRSTEVLYVLMGRAQAELCRTVKQGQDIESTRNPVQALGPVAQKMPQVISPCLGHFLSNRTLVSVHADSDPISLWID